MLRNLRYIIYCLNHNIIIYALDQIMEQGTPDDWVDIKELNLNIPENDGKTDSFRKLFSILDKAL